jgi:nucleotide-binding universal stress UspA family protein
MIDLKLKKRRSFDTGHKPKYLVLADDSAEFDRALYFAARRAIRNNATLVILCVIKQSADQEWLGIGDIMQAEAEAKAAATLEKAAAHVRDIAGIEAECVIRTGQKVDEICALIAEDEDISVLILATGIGVEGPGPLISLLAGKTGVPFTIPVTIVPGNLRDDEIEALT